MDYSARPALRELTRRSVPGLAVREVERALPAALFDIHLK